jgi:hypothetical protein
LEGERMRGVEAQAGRLRRMKKVRRGCGAGKNNEELSMQKSNLKSTNTYISVPRPSAFPAVVAGCH